MRRLLVVPAAALVVVAGCGGSNDAPKSSETTKTSSALNVFTVHGYLDLVNGAQMLSGSDTECVGGTGYEDIARGASVVVSDDAGRKVALGELEAGRAVPRLTACRFEFTVPDIPAGSAVYSVKVAERGSLDFKESDAGSLKMTLGHL